MKLTTRSLSFAYGNKKVLSQVDLELLPGCMVCLAGPNGSGKSTLLKCLDRILRPQKGMVAIDGRDIREFSRRELARKVAYVPQSASQNLGFSVFEAVMMGRKPFLNFRVREDDCQTVMQVLGMMDLGHMAQRYFDELSGGEKQKVLIARALAQKSRILLLDEPTSNLDLRYQLEVAELLTRLKNRHGLTMVMALHDLNLAARYSDKVVMLHQGGIFAQGPPAKVLNPENIRTVYGVEAIVSLDGQGRPTVQPLRPADDMPVDQKPFAKSGIAAS
jgi:iron complex transport system ATP-binding protein